MIDPKLLKDSKLVYDDGHFQVRDITALIRKPSETLPSSPSRSLNHTVFPIACIVAIAGYIIYNTSIKKLKISR